MSMLVHNPYGSHQSASAKYSAMSQGSLSGLQWGKVIDLRYDYGMGFFWVDDLIIIQCL